MVKEGNKEREGMLLGKRQRGPMRRTTSMAGISVDLPSNVGAGSSEPSDDTTQNHQMIIRGLHASAGLEEGSLDYHNKNNMMDTSCGGNTSGFLHDQPFLASMLSPRNHHKSSGSGNHFVEDSHFLRTCGLCKRRLAPGKDLYMYRGDTAFCSQECRAQQMKQDERKENRNVMITSKKGERHASASTTSSKSSRKSETVAAA